MKLSHAHGAAQDGQVMVERPDRMWSTGEGNGKPLQYSCLENPMISMKRQNDRILKEELLRSVGANMPLEISGEITPERMKGWSQNKNNTQLWRWRDKSKVWCRKEQYCIGIWNVRSMNQGKLEVVKQEIARVNIDNLGISEMDWNGFSLRGPLYLLLWARIP